MKRLAWVMSVLFLLTSTLALAREHRSHAVIDAFKREHPCPANGERRGRCPGFIIDHIKPLCAGGPDDPSNMQWQTVKAAKAKDKIERQECSAMRH